MDESNSKKEDFREQEIGAGKLLGGFLKPKKNTFLLMILIGVLLLVIIWPLGDSGKKEEAGKEQSILLGESADGNNKNADAHPKEAGEAAPEEELFSYASYLEKTLEEILSSVDGVGKVKVMITLESSGESVLEKDVVKQRTGTTEVDGTGGSRNTTDISEQEETVYVQQEGSGQQPFVKRMEAPKVKGVLVVAQGGQNQKTAKNITEAIVALFDIEAHKIKVVKMNSQ